MTKKTNNKGFSLVELIIVIAIMAVLMVVLAPQLLRYVESSRLQRDNSAISEIANAVEIACANENVMAEIGTGLTLNVTVDAQGNQTITPTAVNASGATATNLTAELTNTIGAAGVTTTSRTYRTLGANGDEIAINITAGAGGTVTIQASNWAAAVDANAGGTNNF